MATRIRLRRVGRKKLPLYRIVVADQESPRDGRFLPQRQQDLEQAKSLLKQAGVFKPTAV